MLLAGDELREPLAFGVRPARGECPFGRIFGGPQRVVDDLRAGVGQHDEREACVALVRLAGDEADPLERGDLPGNAGRRDA